MKKFYYALIFLIPIIIVIVSFVLVEKVGVIVTILPEKISITDTLMTSNINSELQIIANVYPLQAERKELNWTSNDSDIADVLSDGKVLVKDKVGTVVITAKTANNVTNSVTIKVVDKLVRGVNITNKISWLDLNEIHNTTYSVLPNVGAEIKTIIWSSSNTDVFTIHNGQITPKKAGKATVTLWIDGFIDTFDLEIVNTVKTINLLNNNTITEKDTINLLNHISTIPQNADKRFIYELDNNDIAHINGNNLIFSTPGVVNVLIKPMYSDTNISALLTIESTVRTAKSASLALLPTLNVSKPYSSSLNIMDYLNVVPSDYSGVVILESSNELVIEVDSSNPHILNALRGGTTVISVRLNGATISQPLSVIEHVSGIMFAYSADTPDGVIETFTNPFVNRASVTNMTATNKALRYTSDNIDIATVDSSGMVTFKQNDKEVTITATSQDEGLFSQSYKIISRATDTLITDLNVDITDESGNDIEVVDYNGSQLLINQDNEFTVNFNSDYEFSAKTIDWDFESSDLPSSVFSHNGFSAKVNLQKGQSGKAVISYLLTLTNEYDQVFEFPSERHYYFSNNKVISFDVALNKNTIYILDNAGQLGQIDVTISDIFPSVSDLSDLDIIFKSTDDVISYNKELSLLTVNKPNTNLKTITLTWTIDGVTVSKQISLVVVSKNITFDVLDASSANNTYTSVIKDTYELSAAVWPDNTNNKNFKFVSSNTEVAVIDDNNVLRFKSHGTATVSVYALDRIDLGLTDLLATKTFSYVSVSDAVITSQLSYNGDVLEINNNFLIELEYLPRDLATLFENQGFRIVSEKGLFEITDLTSKTRINAKALTAGQDFIRIYYNDLLLHSITLDIYNTVVDSAEFVKDGSAILNDSEASRFVIGSKKLNGATESDQQNFTFTYRVAHAKTEFNAGEFLTFTTSSGQKLTSQKVSDLHGVFVGQLVYTLPIDSKEEFIVITNSLGVELAKYNFTVLKGAVNIKTSADLINFNKTANAKKVAVMQDDIKPTTTGTTTLHVSLYGNGYMLNMEVAYMNTANNQLIGIGQDDLEFNNVNFKGFMNNLDGSGKPVVQTGTKRFFIIQSRAGIVFKNSSISNHNDLIFLRSSSVTFDGVIFHTSNNRLLRIITDVERQVGADKLFKAEVTVRNSAFYNSGAAAIHLKNSGARTPEIVLNLEGNVYFYNYIPDTRPIVTDPAYLYGMFKDSFYQDDYILTTTHTNEEGLETVVKHVAVALYTEPSNKARVTVNTHNMITPYLEDEDGNQIGDLRKTDLFSYDFYRILNTSHVLQNLDPINPHFKLDWVN